MVEKVFPQSSDAALGNPPSKYLFLGLTISLPLIGKLHLTILIFVLPGNACKNPMQDGSTQEDDVAIQ